MTDAEKRDMVVEGLKELQLHFRAMAGISSSKQGRASHIESARTIGEAIALLKKSFTPQEVYDTVIEHAQHDKRFKLGDKIDYSFSDVVDILNMELMCKAGDM